jgi:hypothetical protein
MDAGRVIRTNEIKIRFTDAERSIIKAKAFKAGLQEAVFIREVCLHTEVKAAITTEQMKEIRLVSSVSQNLNQLVKEMHRQGLVKVAVEVEEMLNYIKQLLWN